MWREKKSAFYFFNIKEIYTAKFFFASLKFLLLVKTLFGSKGNNAKGVGYIF